MSKAQERSIDLDSLWRRAQKRRDRQARHEIILHYAPLVNYIVGRLAVGLPNHVERDDLFSYGVMGLLDAVGRFQPERGLKFETFAIPRIRGSILDGLRKADWVPRRTREKIKRYEKVQLKLQTELGREPTEKELREELELSEPQFHKLMVEVGWLSLHSLEALIGIGKDGEELYLGDLVSDEETPQPGLRLLQEEEKKLLGQAIDALPQREAYVINLYYYNGLTVKEISQVLGVSEPRVSQIHGKALLRLRRSLLDFRE
jgi:RNA polymerase sigma factor for flagellar operon FliA